MFGGNVDGGHVDNRRRTPLDLVEGKRSQGQVWREQFESAWASQLGNDHGLEMITGE